MQIVLFAYARIFTHSTPRPVENVPGKKNNGDFLELNFLRLGKHSQLHSFGQFQQIQDQGASVQKTVWTV